MKKLIEGEKARFKTTCGVEIEGTVVKVRPNGYVVKGDTITSNQHKDGLFRFTFT